MSFCTIDVTFDLCFDLSLVKVVTKSVISFVLNYVRRLYYKDFFTICFIKNFLIFDISLSN